MAQELVLICEDCLEGAFTAIYDAYLYKKEYQQIRIAIKEDDNYSLFTEYQRIHTEPDKAVKVIQTLQKRFGEQAYYTLCMALASYIEDKVEAVYRTIQWNLSHPRSGDILDHLSDDNIRKVLEYSRGSNYELCHLRGFTRFEELEQGFLYAEIKPKNHLITYLAEHFSDRLPQENFIMKDDGRDLYVVHPAGKEWFLVTGQDGRGGGQDLKEWKLSEEELRIQELFCQFCNKIGIDSRKNLKLQRNMLPLRFRPYMTEFK